MSDELNTEMASNSEIPSGGGNRKRKRFGVVVLIMLLLSCALLIQGCGKAEDTSSNGSAEVKSIKKKTKKKAKKKKEEEVVQEDPEQNLEISFIDVGQGDAALVVLPDGKTMLVDAGPDVEAKAVKNELETKGITSIDFLVATHADSDHIAGMQEIVNGYSFDEFIAPKTTHTTDSYLDLLTAIKAKDKKATAALAGDVLDYSDDFSVRILSPAEDQSYSESNDWSVVLLITYKDRTVLLTGDASTEVLNGLNCSDVDVLKVSHHGSDTGTDAALVKKLNPKYAIISYAPTNDYGHPAQSVLDALAGVEVCGTGVNGTIRLTSDGKTIDIKSEKSGVVEAPKQQGTESETSSGQEEASTADGATEAQGQNQTQAQTQEQAQAETQQQAQQSRTVVITPTGSKYHQRGCRTLSRSKSLTEMTEEQAQAQGYTACLVCGG